MIIEHLQLCCEWLTNRIQIYLVGGASHINVYYNSKYTRKNNDDYEPPNA